MLFKTVPFCKSSPSFKTASFWRQALKHPSASSGKTATIVFQTHFILAERNYHYLVRRFRPTGTASICFVSLQRQGRVVERLGRNRRNKVSSISADSRRPPCCHPPHTPCSSRTTRSPPPNEAVFRSSPIIVLGWWRFVSKWCPFVEGNFGFGVSQNGTVL